MKDINNNLIYENEDIQLLKKNNHEYMEKISLLEEDNKLFKEKQKDLKKKLKEFAIENNHLISIVNKEKVKNSKLKSYIQNVLNTKREDDDETLSNSSNNNSSNNNVNNANEKNINFTENSITNSNESIETSSSYQKIRNQDKFTIKHNLPTRDYSNSIEMSINDKTSEKNSNIKDNNNNIINNKNNNNYMDNDIQEGTKKISRKSLKSDYSSESTEVPSEGETSTNSLVSGLTKVNFDKNSLDKIKEFSLPVIYLKANDKNNIVQAKNLIKESKNNKNSYVNTDNDVINNNNQIEKQENSVIKTNDFLPSIAATSNE